MASEVSIGDDDDLRRCAILLLGANASLAFAALTFSATTGTAGLQAVGVQALLATCAHIFLLYGFRSDLSGERASERAVERAVEPASRDFLFWTLVVPVLLYAFGAGVAVIGGAHRLGLPIAAQLGPFAESYIAHWVVALAAVWMVVALGMLFYRRVPPVLTDRQRALRLMMVVATLAGLSGVGVAAVSSMLGRQGSAEADGYGAILIGLVMAAAAARLALEIRSEFRRELRVRPERVGGPIQKPPVGDGQATLAIPSGLEIKSATVASSASGPVAGTGTESMPRAAVEPSPANPGQKPQVVARQPGKRGAKRR